MFPVSEPHRWSALDMVDALHGGRISSVELVEALQRRSDDVEPAVGAYCVQLRASALAAARHCDATRTEATGPLFGMPFSVKENIATEGVPVTMGLRSRLDRPETTDAVVVQVLREQGGIVLGKSNIPLLMLSLETHNDIWGTTRNPWDTARVPGGSSGGEAALIASGQSPWGLGTDIGGSVRIPCAWCGIAGLKPSVGRWSPRGQFSAIRGQEVIKAVMGPMARTSRDVAALWRAVSPEAQAARDPRFHPRPLGEPASVDLSGLTVGVYEDDGVFAPSASVRRAVRTAADHLAACGARVVQYVPPDGWALVDLYFGALSADGGAGVLAHLSEQPPTPQLRTLLQLARTPGVLRRAAMHALAAAGEHRVARVGRAFGAKSAGALFALAAARTAAQDAELAAWNALGLDLVVGPPTVTPPALIDETFDWTLGGWHTMRWNVVDLPAGVVPVSTVRPHEATPRSGIDRLDKKAGRFEVGSTGLPVAAQVIGRPGGEDHVLAAMMAIEDAARDTAGFPHTPVG